MFRSIRYFIRLLLLLLIYFLIQRTVFIIYQSEHSAAISLSEYLQSTRYALILDIAAGCYIMAIPALIWVIMLMARGEVMQRMVWWFMIFIIITTGIIHIVDLGLYAEWGSKINHKALACLAYPREAVASTLSSPVLLLLLILAAESATVLVIYRKWVHPMIGTGGTYTAKILMPVLLLCLLFIGSRGGTQDKPVRKGDVYFSNNPMINQASANSFWNFINVLATPDACNPEAYKYMPDEEAARVVGSLFTALPDSTTSLFTIEKPNFIVVMMESFSAEVVGAFGGTYGATPNLDSLAAEGFTMSDFYATGFRTDQGLVATISGFPSQPKTAVIYSYGKFEKLPSLAAVLVNDGYQTAYFSAGDNSFANTDAYLLSSGFQKISGQESMVIRRKALFGGYDDELFTHYLNLPAPAQPFYHQMVTIVSHEPFDAKVDPFRPGNKLIDKYINTIHFTDSAIGEFIRQARSKPWFRNTVFIFFGDHAHRMPKKHKAWEVLRHKIPFIVYGEPLRPEFRGKSVSRTACQTDFPNFICRQLHLSDSAFAWGKDFMNPRARALAYYTFEDGLGIISGDTNVVFDNQRKQVITARYPGQPDSVNNRLFRDGEALLQQITAGYNGLGN